MTGRHPDDSVRNERTDGGRAHSDGSLAPVPRYRWPEERREIVPDQVWARRKREFRSTKKLVFDEVARGSIILTVAFGIAGTATIVGGGLGYGLILLGFAAIMGARGVWVVRSRTKAYEDGLWRIQAQRRDDLERTDPEEYVRLRDLAAEKERLTAALASGELKKSNPEVYQRLREIHADLREAEAQARAEAIEILRARQAPRPSEARGTWFSE